MRRFLFRPSGVWLDAIGSDSPIPIASTLSLGIPWRIKYSAILFARCFDKFLLKIIEPTLSVWAIIYTFINKSRPSLWTRDFRKICACLLKFSLPEAKLALPDRIYFSFSIIIGQPFSSMATVLGVPSHRSL